MKNPLSYIWEIPHRMKERNKQQAQDKKNIALFWENFTTLSPEDKAWVLEIAEWYKGEKQYFAGSEEEKIMEKKVITFKGILPAWLSQKTLRLRSKTKIKQEKEKIRHQEELMSALLPDTEYEGSGNDDEIEAHFGRGTERVVTPESA